MIDSISIVSSHQESRDERMNMLERQRQVALRRRKNQMNSASIMRTTTTTTAANFTNGMNSANVTHGMNDVAFVNGTNGGSLISQVQINTSYSHNSHGPAPLQLQEQRTHALRSFSSTPYGENGDENGGNGCFYQQSSTTVYGNHGMAHPMANSFANSNGVSGYEMDNNGVNGVVLSHRPILQPMIAMAPTTVLSQHQPVPLIAQHQNPVLAYNEQASLANSHQPQLCHSQPGHLSLQGRMLMNQQQHQIKPNNSTNWISKAGDNPYNGKMYHSAMEDDTVISELTENRFDQVENESYNAPHSNDHRRSEARQVSCGSNSKTNGSEQTANHRSPSTPRNAKESHMEKRGSKIKRSPSTRSLSFEESNVSVSSSKEKMSTSPSIDENDGPSTSKTASKEKSDAPKSEAPNPSIAKFVEDIKLDDPAVMRSFLMKPCPKGAGMVQCYIKRNKGIKNALFPEYRMYLKNKDNTFLMTSKKRTGSKTSNYLISMSRNDHDKHSSSIIGKLRSNFLGTEYVIYDGGKNPQFDDSYFDEKNNEENIRCELGAILYASTTSLGDKGPRKMKVCIGKVDEEGNPVRVWQPMDKNDERMISCFKDREDSPHADKLVCFDSKPPSWNKDVEAFCLNFNGRVTMASVKNFQLVEEGKHEGDIFLQFGRVEKDKFSLDVQWPLSPFQAFALALSSFDMKIGCD